MVSMYVWHQIRMRREKGEGIKTIARGLGVSKNTVRKYLRSSDPPKFKVRRYEKKLDKFREKICDMLRQGYIGTRIYEELLGMGYEGSLSSVHKYLHRCKREEAARKLSTTRVETSPGQQMQYDWKEWKLSVGDRLVRIYLHEVVLSYSRRKHYSFSLSIGSQDVIRALESAIFFFGGSARELLIDNAKQMVLSHRINGVVSYNEEFLRFCGLYGIEPRACTPYRARTKDQASYCTSLGIFEVFLNRGIRSLYLLPWCGLGNGSVMGSKRSSFLSFARIAWRSPFSAKRRAV